MRKSEKLELILKYLTNAFPERTHHIGGFGISQPIRNFFDLFRLQARCDNNCVVDKAPRLSIKRVIWILASDTVFVQLNQ